MLKRLRRIAIRCALLSALVLNPTHADPQPAAELPDFGAAARTTNSDPENASIPVNAPMDVVYLGKSIHLSQGASRSALAMIDYFREPAVSRSLHASQVLELGSGTGLAGIGAVLHGARVDFTDQSIVMELLERNVGNNLDFEQLQRSRFHELQWHADHRDHALISTRYDHIIAADIVYAKESIGPLVETLLAFSRADTVIHLAYIQRFAWSREFFDRMDAWFERTLIERNGNLWLFRFTRTRPAG